MLTTAEANTAFPFFHYEFVRIIDCPGNDILLLDSPSPLPLRSVFQQASLNESNQRLPYHKSAAVGPQAAHRFHGRPGLD